VIKNNGTEGMASMMWPTPAGLARLMATIDVVQGLVAKLERMNVEMQDQLRCNEDLLTIDKSDDLGQSKYYLYTCPNESRDYMTPSAPAASLMSMSSETKSGAGSVAPENTLGGRPRIAGSAAPENTSGGRPRGAGSAAPEGTSGEKTQRCW